MTDRGAPTGKWPAQLDHLEDDSAFDLRSSSAQLVVRRPDVPEVTIPLNKSEFVIGREMQDVDLTLDDELVSRRHARLTVSARGYFTLEDLGSTNGIEYAGRPVRRLNLIDGDEFIIGKTRFLFSAVIKRLSAETEKKPTMAADPLFDDIEVPVPRHDREAQNDAARVRPLPFDTGSDTDEPTS